MHIMQKMFHVLFVAIIFFNGSVFGMKSVTDGLNRCEGVSEQVTNLFRCAHLGDHEHIKVLLDEGISPDYQGMFDITPLFIASRNGYTEVVRVLLDAGADVNLESSAGCTPLHAASDRGDIEAVKLLLAAGASVWWKNCNKQMPFHMAKKVGHVEIAQLLHEQMKRDELKWKKAKLAKRKTW